MISDAFQKQFGRHVLVAEDGSLRLTALGRKELAPRLTRHGFDASQIRSMEAFTRAMSVVNDLEFEANTEAMRELAASPGLTELEREVLANLLGEPVTAPVRPVLRVV